MLKEEANGNCGYIEDEEERTQCVSEHMEYGWEIFGNCDANGDFSIDA